MPGYISLHRDIQKHWLYQEERVFSRYEAWLDILIRVNHTEGKVTHNGTVETIPRGSTIWSMGDMEKHWGWSNKKVKRFLLCLESDQMLSVKSTTKKTYLTVINYDFYQDTGKQKAPPMHQESTADAFQKHTNNNVDNVLNDLNTSNSTTTDDYELIRVRFRELHALIDLPYQDSPLLTKLLADEIPRSTIIGVMESRFKASAKTLKYYEAAIRETHNKMTLPLAAGGETYAKPRRSDSSRDSYYEQLREISNGTI